MNTLYVIYYDDDVGFIVKIYTDAKVLERDLEAGRLGATNEDGVYTTIPREDLNGYNQYNLNTLSAGELLIIGGNARQIEAVVHRVSYYIK